MYNNQIINDNSRKIVGDNNIISGDKNYITGDNNRINGVYCNINGDNNIISGNYHHICGDKNNISGDYHRINGDNNNVSGDFNTVDGKNNVIKGYGNQKNGTNWYNHHNNEEKYNPACSVLNQNNGIVANNMTGNVICNVNGVSNCSDSFNIHGHPFLDTFGDFPQKKYHANNVNQMDDNTTNYFVNDNQVPHHFQVMDNNTTNSSGQNNHQQVPQKPKPIITVAELERDEFAEEGERTCVICTDRKPNVLFMPCHHLILCAHCTDELLKKENALCPKCRKIIDGVIVSFD